jgi:hypothetical protein
MVLEYDPAGRVELPVRREPFDKPPCFACEKVPDRIRQRKQRLTSKADALELSPRNLKVYTHWKGCQATMDWPRGHGGGVDPHVKRHAGIIADLLRQRNEQLGTSRFNQLVTLLTTMRAH